MPDVLIIGAGPAGIAAACAASESGCSVAVVDDNPFPGGQIWRAERTSWLERFGRSGARLLQETRLIDCPRHQTVLVESAAGVSEIEYSKLIIATGARELILPFPGWTLPNVMGAGGLQALVKSGLPVKGKRVVVAGSGPLLLAVAAYLRKHGAAVPLIAEQAALNKLMQFSLTLARSPAKTVQAANLRFRLIGCRYITGCWPVSADETGTVLRCGERTWREPCDYVACGFGLVPNIEAPMLLGCALHDGFVITNEWQETSLHGIYCAGEPTGIGGLDLALASGQIAGYHSSGQIEKARRHFPVRERAMNFTRALQCCFALREELKTLPTPETIVCRCEDVCLGRIRAQHSWRSAKLQTRCGMGPCQGRVCGPAIEFLLGWKQESVRPPLFPVSASQLAQ